MIEHAKYTYWFLEKQTKKQIDALKSLNPFDKIYELKQTESIKSKSS